MRTLLFYLRVIFYKVIWHDCHPANEDNNQYGYFLVKRKWVWLLLFPLIIAAYTVWHFCLIIASYLPSLENNYGGWIQSKDEKLSHKEYMNTFNRLWY